MQGEGSIIGKKQVESTLIGAILGLLGSIRGHCGNCGCDVDYMEKRHA
jgi:hypothetical protein